MTSQGKSVAFDQFRVDLENRLLFRNEEVVGLAPKTFELLVALVENRGAVIDKDTLIRRVWPDVFIEESNLTKNISLLRKCLGNDPTGKAYIDTVPRRGYRFQAELAETSPTNPHDVSANLPGAGAAARTRRQRLSFLWVAAALSAVLLFGSVRLLRPSHSSVDRLPTTSREAFELVQRGKSMFAASRRAGRSTNVQITELFRRALLLDPDYADAYAWLALSLSGSFQPAETLQAAAAYARKALESDPRQVVARRALIELSSARGTYRAGLAEAKKLLEIAPRDPQALVAAGQAYVRCGIADRGIALLEQALEIDPDFNEAQTALSHALSQSGQFLRVIDLYASPARPNRERWLMRAYSETGNFEKALAIARKFESQAGEPTEALTHGIIFLASGKPDAARKTWKEGAVQTEAELKLEDQSGKRISLALLYARLGQAGKARENVHRALSLAPGHPWALFFAGEMEALLGNYPGALDYIREAVKRDWLRFQSFDYYQRPHHGFYPLRNNPEYRRLRSEVARKAEALSKQF